MNRILLHHCCMPCSPKVLEYLTGNFSVESYWYNPNVHPAAEHDARKESLIKYIKELALPLHLGPVMVQDEWLAKAPEADRCKYCYSTRLKQTAATALEMGIQYFSTTLLSSPYQKHGLIASIGEETAQSYGLQFVYFDLRAQYYEGKNEAYRRGSYMQKYCGCIFSIRK